MTEPPADAPEPRETRETREVREEAPDDALRCWRCRSPHDRYQEYCLECGARLVPLPTGSTTWRREMWTRDSPFWFWATFLALLLTALVAGAIVLAATRGEGDEEQRPGAAAGPTTSEIAPLETIPTVPTDPATTGTLPDTIQIPPPVVPQPPPATPPPTPPATPPPTPPATPPPTPPAAGGVRDWPSGQTGYTVILSSVPQGQGRAAAEARAREAIAKGLDEVGVLNSDDYSSLTRGYFVVFSGVHDSQSQAEATLATVRQAGYPVAYVRRIEP